MKGLRSTLALVVVLGGLAAYIYFVTWKTPAEPASKLEKVFSGLQADKIDEVKVTSDKGEVSTLKKDNGTWQLVAPVAAKADEAEASAIATALGQVEIVRVIDENPTDLKDYGLATPRIAVDFKGTGDKDYRRLLIGEKSPTGADLFAKRNDEKKVFLIAAAPESTLNKSTFELRDKTVLAFERDKVDAVSVGAGGKTLELTKDNTDWKITQPLQARADYGSVEGLIGRLQTAGMKTIVSENPSANDLKQYGLDKPAATVDLKLGSARATLAVGGKAADNTVYARDASKPMVVTIDSALADELKKGADEYRRKDLFEFRPYNATRVEITRDTQTVAFEKTKGTGENAEEKWRRVSPTAGDVDKDKVDSLLSRLSNMRAASFVAASAKTGVDMPAMTVVAKFDDGKKEERVTFGKVDNDVYAARPGEPGAAKVDAMDLTEANKTLDELAK
ncbi:MAG: DUF4340 domain-containing protein [Acidobacteriota bacterium]